MEWLNKWCHIYTMEYLLLTSNSKQLIHTQGTKPSGKKAYLKRLQRGQTAHARRTTTLQPVEGKPHSQTDRQNEKAEDFVPDEGTR